MLKRKLETEFQALDSMEGKMQELDSMRKVRGSWLCALGLFVGAGSAGPRGFRQRYLGTDGPGEQGWVGKEAGAVRRGRRCRAMGVGVTVFGVPGSRWTRGARLGVNGRWCCALEQGLRQQACLVQGTCLLWLVVCLKTTAKQQQQ